ncbi:hypothetical protein [Companilactobacillus furfuricola]|uniref:hypothetical protein n=1 Tax=Companilactobacillus furfuricola TaxID=1462575 RepID=UPI000F7B6C64|nr:hypothetical protein [Companilactobacillus furfuricola]
MDISLKLGTDNFLKTQLTSADTLLKPLLVSNGDHLLIKELTTSGDYRNLQGDLDLSKDLYLLVYIKLNNEQISIFEDKVYNKFDEFVEKDNQPAIFQKRADFNEYLLINSFSHQEDLGLWKDQIKSLIENGIQAVSNEPLKFFTKAYQKEL